MGEFREPTQSEWRERYDDAVVGLLVATEEALRLREMLKAITALVEQPVVQTEARVLVRDIKDVLASVPSVESQ